MSAARLRRWSLVALMCAAGLTHAGCGARSTLEADDGGPGQTGVPEICNGRDDDGDGRIDEDLGELSCGIGACQRVVAACQGGTMAACEPGPPSDESCNGIDDDCDGATDEGLGFGPVRGPFTVAVGPYFGGNAIVPMGDGLLLATTHAAEPEGESASSIFMLPIDLDGQPTGPEQRVLDNAFWGPDLIASGEMAAMVSSCWSSTGESRAASVRVDDAGAALGGPIVRAPTNRSCGAGYPVAAWTGSHHLFAWIDNSSGPVPGHEVLFDVADEDGLSLGARELYPDGDLVNGSPSFAAHDTRFALAFGVHESGAPTASRFWLGDFDAAGDDVGAPRILSGPDELVSFSSPRLVARAQGGVMLLAGDRFWPGLYRGAFTADLSGPSALERVDGFEGRTVVSVSLRPRPGGGSVAAISAYDEAFDDDGLVASLDDDGAVTAVWIPADPEERGLAGASVAMVGHRVFVAYRIVGDSSEIRLRELGCTP
jgi:Putative metal-binding motif